MATQSLYRRYRPQRFGEVKGQDHVVRALRNAVADGREGQAYLFSGPRGTGKTSSARILAKVLNCENPDAGEPCCECESCLSVESGTSYDVHELDAASNNGVEAMRDLIEKASLGTPGRHKVYILDEVHMLSKSAEAALLKTLEEPPPHVVFVLATTDPQKMSDTIRSRTQHLQFHLLPADTLQEHVRWVADDAGLDVSDAAIEQVLSQGGGSARDALSALELVANTGDEGLDILPLDEFVEAMIERDAGRALTMIGHAVNMGSDPRTLTEELVGYLRNGFLALMAPDMVQVPSDRIDDLADQARRLGPPGLVRGIEHLGLALTEMRHAPDPRVLLDVATVQLTSDSVAPDLGALLMRLERVEKQLADGVPSAGAAASAAGGAATSPTKVDPTTGRAELGGRARQSPSARSSAPVDTSAGSAPAAASEKPVSEQPAPAQPTAEQPEKGSGEATSVAEQSSSAPDSAVAGAAPKPGEAISIEMWENTVRPSLRGMARAVYAPAVFVRSTDSSLTLSVPNAVHRDKCEQHRPVVESALSDLAGSKVQVELVVDEGGGGGGPSRRADGEESSRPEKSAGKKPTQPGETSSTRATQAVDEGQVAESVESESATVPADALQHDDEIDLDDLVDAPPESVKTPINRLAEAFPGSELIEERG
ncbi:MAG: DNA polymerase III subunit gamma/tau [Actinobacteria bacterium]|nr:DNA polymerase III subunit gamma/tau [Actinomycetota bacterium]